MGSENVCKNCKYFIFEHAPYGSCDRWNKGYHFTVMDGETPVMPLNEVLVENDEGWAMTVGPHFGCVLFDRNAPEVTPAPAPQEDDGK